MRRTLLALTFVFLFAEEFSPDWYAEFLGIHQQGLGYFEDDTESPSPPDDGGSDDATRALLGRMERMTP